MTWTKTIWIWFRIDLFLHNFHLW